MTPEDLMALAIEKCREGISAGSTPFGCAIAFGDKVLAVEHNRVWQTVDATAHAEMNAIRTACRATGNVHLQGCVVVTTCEPCPMCMAALHWARVSTVYYGATIADATAAGFNELELAAADLLRLGGSSVQLESGVLVPQCRALFDEWRQRSPMPKAY